MAWSVNAKTTTTGVAGIGRCRVHFEHLGKKGKMSPALNQTFVLSPIEFEFWPWSVELCIKGGIFAANCQWEKDKVTGNIFCCALLWLPLISPSQKSQYLVILRKWQAHSLDTKFRKHFFQKKTQLQHGIANEPRQEDLHRRPPKWRQQVFQLIHPHFHSGLDF